MLRFPDHPTRPDARRGGLRAAAPLLAVALALSAPLQGCDDVELPPPERFQDKNPCPGLACDDNNPCTTDTCETFVGCVHTDVDLTCDDGDACTQGDACKSGVCGPGATVSCADGDVCTDDPACDKTQGCVHPHNTVPCDDGDACTTGEACTQGVCAGGTPAACDDKDPCTDDSCDKAKGCQHTPNTAPCDDGDPCTSGEACAAGACTGGSPTVCDDGNACTDDSCTEGKGCAATAVPGHGACGSDKQCLAGVCVAPPTGMRLLSATGANMGCVNGDTSCNSDESPLHAVTLSPFFLDVAEVSAADFAACVSAGGCTAPDTTCAANATYGVSSLASHPVNCVTWTQATAYCAWKLPTGGRLPTEAEFEISARAGKVGQIFPWGASLSPPAGSGNLPDATAEAAFPAWDTIPGYTDGAVYTAPASAEPLNAWGIRGLHGNVWEWVHDRYSPTYYAASAGSTDPMGPTTGVQRVLRGSGFFWMENAAGKALRLSHRLNFAPSHRNNDLGFRCAQPAKSDAK